MAVPRRRRATTPRSTRRRARRRMLLAIPPRAAAAGDPRDRPPRGIKDSLRDLQPAGSSTSVVAQKARFQGRAVRAEGNYRASSAHQARHCCEYRFTISKNGTEVPVRYAQCVVPDTFRDVPRRWTSASAVEGQLSRTTRSRPRAILAKCPSKYEMKTVRGPGRADAARRARPDRCSTPRSDILGAWPRRGAGWRRTPRSMGSPTSPRPTSDGFARSSRWQALRTPIRYAHALHATSERGSVSIARLVVERDPAPPAAGESSAWIVFAQDDRLPGAFAPPPTRAPLARSRALPSWSRWPSGAPATPRSIARSRRTPLTDRDLSQAMTPSLCKLALSCGPPRILESSPGRLHPGAGGSACDPPSLAWPSGPWCRQFFGEKAAPSG